jgi:hypothetical protein
MIRLSPGILASSHILLKRIYEHNTYNLKSLVEKKINIDGTKSDDVIDTMYACKWVMIEQNNSVLSEKGKKYSLKFDHLIKRQMISDFIKYASDSWISLIPRGRKECIAYIPADILACFRSAELLGSPPSDDVVLWWDQQSQIVRNYQVLISLNLGRIGEKLTIQYEKKRTNIMPIWKSIESNLVGYDVLSVLNKGTTEKLLIEVKTSERPIDIATASISRNEWDTAIESKNYVFHFWLLNDVYQKLAILSIDDLFSHIPKDQGIGKWKEAILQFRFFAQKFHDCLL